MLLFNSSSAIKNSEKVTSQKTSHQNGRHKISIVDLNDDVLFLILNQMDLIEWSNLADVHGVFVSPANDAFRQKYRGFQVRFNNDIYEKRSYGAKKAAFENQLESEGFSRSYIKPKDVNTLVINDYQLALNVLKYFSGNFQTLTLNEGVYGFADRHLWEVVNQYLNRYASNDITHLQIFMYDNTLEQYKLPFNNVEILEGSLSVNQTQDIALPFNRMFPKLRDIKLVLSETEIEILDCEFPHLEDVGLFLSSDGKGKEKQKLIRGFAEKNPQIKSLHVRDFSSECVEYFSQYLPNLVNLTLNLNGGFNSEIEFKGVKNVRLHDKSGKYVTKLSFPQIETVLFKYSYKQRYEWKTFFNKHKNLKKLELDEETYEHHGNNRGRNDLVLLTENLSDLVEVVLSCDYILENQEFTRFIQNHSSLMKVTYHLRGFYSERQSEIQTLREQFEDQWNITQIGDSYRNFIDIIMENFTGLE